MVYKMMDSINAWSAQLKRMLKMLKAIIILLFEWWMGFIPGSLVWQAIHILLESILRHLLLRNDHLCKSFEMVPWLCMSSHRPCAATRGSKLDGETFLTPVSLRLWIRWWRNPPVKWNWWTWKCTSKSSLVGCWTLLILWCLEGSDSCSSCGDASGSDDIAMYHTVSRPCNCISIHSVHPHDLQKMMWNTSSIHPFILVAPKTGCFQTHSVRGFAPLVSMSCWRSSIASRWNKWIDVPHCVTLLRWTKIQALWFDHALARWLYQVLLHPNYVDQVVQRYQRCFHSFFVFSVMSRISSEVSVNGCPFSSPAKINWCWPSWRRNIFRRWVDVQCNGWASSCGLDATWSHNHYHYHVPHWLRHWSFHQFLSRKSHFLDVFTVCPYTSAHPPGHLRLCTLGEFHPGKGLWCYEFETRTRSLGKQV